MTILPHLPQHFSRNLELHIFPLNSTITNNGWSAFLTSPSLETQIGQRNDSATNLAIFKESGLIFRNEVLQKGFPKIRQATLDPIETGDPDTETATGELIPQVANPIPPTIALEGWKGWERLPDTVEAFGRPSMKELKSLSIRGAVSPTNAIFRGRVEIASALPETVYLNNAKYAAKLPRDHGRIVLEDVRIDIDKQGIMTVEHLNNGGSSGSGTPTIADGSGKRSPGDAALQASGANAAPSSFSSAEVLPDAVELSEIQTEAVAVEQTIEGALQLVTPDGTASLPTPPPAPIAPVTAPTP